MEVRLGPAGVPHVAPGINPVPIETFTFILQTNTDKKKEGRSERSSLLIRSKENISSLNAVCIVCVLTCSV